MSIPYPLKHIDEYGEANLDAPTLKLLLDHANTEKQRNDRIRGEIVASKGEAFAQDEWDSLFGQEQQDYAEAARRITAELKRRGIKL